MPDLRAHFGLNPLSENNDYLSEQLITYIGGKRSLLEFIGDGLAPVKKKLNKSKLKIFDVFSGSGIVARYMKRHAELLIVNDMEKYSEVVNKCYLTNKSRVDQKILKEVHSHLLHKLRHRDLREGFICELYAPKDADDIKSDERVFYTPRNAKYIDTARQYIEELPEELKKYFIAPLLSEASVHANTSGVFKGFYKNSETNIGQFGGNNRDALTRILGEIELKYPVFSNYECEYRVYRGDSNQVCEQVDDVDVAYIDPPYNQHPYGSNYFMLNLIADYVRPKNISPVSGIPNEWRRSDYNKKKSAYNSLRELSYNLRAKYLLISFNSEGFVKSEDMTDMLKNIGKVEVMETRYNTFRGSRNLNGRGIHVKEYLYLAEKSI
ncbi:MAG: DNA adenine methylase [Endomicrobiia bacterium]|nr:DNA adenine methylase [Endomicrobiia bacterium]